MRYIFYNFLSLIVVLAVVLPVPATVFAESDVSVKSPPASRAWLIIRAPNIVDVGQSVTITVFGKYSRDNISGASVYALKASELVISAKTDNYLSILSNYETQAKAKGTFIGVTTGEGTVTGKFNQTGRFMLVATKDGFLPGFSRISVNLAEQQRLGIKTAYPNLIRPYLPGKIFDGNDGKSLRKPRTMLIHPK